MEQDPTITDRQVEIDGCLFPGDIITPKTIAYTKNFPVRDDDVFNITYPKSGTTWMQAILSLIVHADDMPKVMNVPSNVRAPWLELETAPGYLDNRPSPRIMTTHAYPNLAPAGILQGKGKVVYTYRNPKDNLMSFYHFHNMATFLRTPESFESFVSDFMQEKLSYGSWFKHIKYWLDVKDKANIMFIAFEDLRSDLAGSVKRIANFLGKKLDAETVQKVVDNCTFANMKKNDLVNYSTVPSSYFSSDKTFMRKGTVGDWQSMFTTALQDEFEACVREKMKGYELDLKWSDRS